MTIIIILLLFFSTHADILLQNCQFSSSFRHPQTTIIKSKTIEWVRERERHSMILMHSIDVVHSISKYSKYLTSKKGLCESFNFNFYCRTITERRIPWKGNLCFKWTYFLCVKLPSEKGSKGCTFLKSFLNFIYLFLFIFSPLVMEITIYIEKLLRLYQ